VLTRVLQEGLGELGHRKEAHVTTEGVKHGSLEGRATRSFSRRSPEGAVPPTLHFGPN
jgi:hypothetical protein